VCDYLCIKPEFRNGVAGYFCIENIKGNTSDLGDLMKLHNPVDTLSMVEYEILMEILLGGDYKDDESA
jgi:hypothetical protein